MILHGIVIGFVIWFFAQWYENYKKFRNDERKYLEECQRERDL